MNVMRDEVIAGYIKEILSARVCDVAIERPVQLARAAQRGKETFAILKHFVDEVITFTTDEICAAINVFLTMRVRSASQLWLWRLPVLTRLCLSQYPDQKETANIAYQIFLAP